VTRVVLPIFPLPDVTFFPHTVLPLHVFEARYRAMVIDALERGRRLAVVQLKPGFEASYAGKPAVHDVAGAGAIVSAERLATGRYNIVLKGVARVRIVRELPSDTLYRIILADVLDETAPTGDVEPLLARVRAACRALLEVLGRPADLLDGAVGADLAPAAVADRVASAVLPGAALRQEVLETLDVQARLERVAVALDELVIELRGRRE
jgi:Lon protease-like protein